MDVHREGMDVHRDLLDGFPNAVELRFNHVLPIICWSSAGHLLVICWQVHVDDRQLVLDDVAEHLTDLLDRLLPDDPLTPSDDPKDGAMQQPHTDRRDGSHTPEGTRCGRNEVTSTFPPGPARV